MPPKSKGKKDKKNKHNEGTKEENDNRDGVKESNNGCPIIPKYRIIKGAEKEAQRIATLPPKSKGEKDEKNKRNKGTKKEIDNRNRAKERDNRCSIVPENKITKRADREVQRLQWTPEQLAEMILLGRRLRRKVEKNRDRHPEEAREDLEKTKKDRQKRKRFGWTEWIEQIKPEKLQGDAWNKEQEVQTDTTQVQSHDKCQQTNEQYPYNMSCSQKTMKTIGPNGGIIELDSYKVFYPPNSLTEEKEIELSIDNNPCNFPKEGLPITSILNIKPSMKLEIPATVTMPTTCKAASGEATIQIWSKEEGQDWEKSQTVPLTNKNEITFETHHFSGKTGTSVDGEESNLEFTLKNRLFIQKDTGTILSVFWMDDKNMLDTVRECNEQEFKRVIPTDQLLTGTLDFEFEVAALCVSPFGIVYSSAKEQEDPAVLKITSEFIISRCPQSIRFLPSVDEFPDSIKRLRIKYSVSTQKTETHLVKWPVEIKEPGSSSANSGFQVNVNHKEITGYKEQGGGAIDARNANLNTQISE